MGSTKVAVSHSRANGRVRARISGICRERRNHRWTAQYNAEAEKRRQTAKREAIVHNLQSEDALLNFFASSTEQRRTETVGDLFEMPFTRASSPTHQGSYQLAVEYEDGTTIKISTPRLSCGGKVCDFAPRRETHEHYNPQLGSSRAVQGERPLYLDEVTFDTLCMEPHRDTPWDAKGRETPDGVKLAPALDKLFDTRFWHSPSSFCRSPASNSAHTPFDDSTTVMSSSSTNETESAHCADFPPLELPLVDGVLVENGSDVDSATAIWSSKAPEKVFDLFEKPWQAVVTRVDSPTSATINAPSPGVPDMLEFLDCELPVSSAILDAPHVQNAAADESIAWSLLDENDIILPDSKDCDTPYSPEDPMWNAAWSSVSLCPLTNDTWDLGAGNGNQEELDVVWRSDATQTIPSVWRSFDTTFSSYEPSTLSSSIYQDRQRNSTQARLDVLRSTPEPPRFRREASATVPVPAVFDGRKES